MCKTRLIHPVLVAIALSNVAGLAFMAAAAKGEDASFKTEFLTLCDTYTPAFVQNARSHKRGGPAFFVNSYAIRALCVAYDLTGKKDYLDACKAWSDRMVDNQNGMIPKGTYDMNYARLPGQKEKDGENYVADCSSIAEGVLTTSIRCTDPAEKQRYLDSAETFAKLVAEKFVRPSGGVTDGWWSGSSKEWFCSTGIFGALAFELYNETGKPEYLKLGLGAIDYLNGLDIAKTHTAVPGFGPAEGERPSVFMYAMEAYSAGLPHLKPGTERYEKAMLQFLRLSTWLARPLAQPHGINYLEHWGTKTGASPSTCTCMPGWCPTAAMPSAWPTRISGRRMPPGRKRALATASNWGRLRWCRSRRRPLRAKSIGPASKNEVTVHSGQGGRRRFSAESLVKTEDLAPKTSSVPARSSDRIQQRQPHRLMGSVRLDRRKGDFVGLDRVVQIAVRRAIVAQTVEKMVDLPLERMVRHVAGIGQDRRQLDPVGLPGKLVRPDAIVEHRARRAEDADGKTVGHDAIGIDRHLADHPVVERHQGHLQAVVFHGRRVFDPGVRARDCTRGFRPCGIRRPRQTLPRDWPPRTRPSRQTTAGRRWHGSRRRETR